MAECSGLNKAGRTILCLTKQSSFQTNFLKGDIDSLWEAAEVKPMVNQVLCHVSNTPPDLIEYCRDKGIVMEAYSPVAHGEALKNEAIAEMAKKYDVSVPPFGYHYGGLSL